MWLRVCRVNACLFTLKEKEKSSEIRSAGFNPLSSPIAQYQTAVNFILLKFVPLLIYASSDIIGDTKAQIGLGQLHYQGGRGVTVDYKTAYTYFQHAADKSNNPNAQAYLGRMYMEDNSFSKKNYDLAFKYFKDAAHQSNAMGQAGLGQLYLNGYGVKKVKIRSQNTVGYKVKPCACTLFLGWKRCLIRILFWFNW